MVWIGNILFLIHQVSVTNASDAIECIALESEETVCLDLFVTGTCSDAISFCEVLLRFNHWQRWLWTYTLLEVAMFRGDVGSRIWRCYQWAMVEHVVQIFMFSVVIILQWCNGVGIWRIEKSHQTLIWLWVSKNYVV